MNCYFISGALTLCIVTTCLTQHASFAQSSQTPRVSDSDLRRQIEYLLSRTDDLESRVDTLESPEETPKQTSASKQHLEFKSDPKCELIPQEVILPNGEKWSGLTDPPSPVTFRTDHPRIFVTPESLGDLREKLRHQVYAEEVKLVRSSNNTTDMAFCYLVWGDETKGQEAIRALLNWDIQPWRGMQDASDKLQGVLMYDWLYNLMTLEQRQLASEAVMSQFPKNVGEPVRYFHSDELVRGRQWRLIAALALDNDWALQWRSNLLKPNWQGLKVYHGILDTLTINSLANGGGWHAGQSSGAILDGYEFGYATMGGPLVLDAWETATRESVFERTTYFDRLPYDIAKVRMDFLSVMSAFGWVALDYCTGINKGRSAELAKWLLEKYPKDLAGYMTVLRLLIGDRRVHPSSPQQLNLPLFGYQDGANCVYVRSSWEDTATGFLFFARHWDRGRFEQASGSLVIMKNGIPVLPMGTNYKAIQRDVYTQLRVWDGKTAHQSQASTKQGGLTYHGSVAYTPADVVDPSKPWHRPETLTHLSVSNGRVTATTRFEKILRVVTPVAHRTVVIDPSAETVQVSDLVELGAGLFAESNFGLHERPSITGNVIENSVVKITVQSGWKEIIWDESEKEKDSRGTQWTVGTVKIRPIVEGRIAKIEVLVEVK